MDLKPRPFTLKSVSFFTIKTAQDASKHVPEMVKNNSLIWQLNNRDSLFPFGLTTVCHIPSFNEYYQKTVSILSKDQINTCYNVPRLCNHFESISYFIHTISVSEEHKLFLLKAPRQRLKTRIN